MSVLERRDGVAPGYRHVYKRIQSAPCLELGETTLKWYDLAPAESAREMLGAEPDEDEAAMARIMSQTDVEMDQPENKVRRDAIAHLKAAYAATEAARALGETPGDDTEVRSAFRQDLDTVIRPVRRGS